MPTAERSSRVVEFDVLFADHLHNIERSGPQDVRMSLVGPEGLATVVQDLVDRETSCCSFFEFSVSAAPPEEAGRETVRLEIRVPLEHAGVLASLIGRAGSTTGSRDDG